MMIPIILIAIGVFYVYLQIKLVNTIPGLVIAHTVHSLLFVLIATQFLGKKRD